MLSKLNFSIQDQLRVKLTGDKNNVNDQPAGAIGSDRLFYEKKVKLLLTFFCSFLVGTQAARVHASFSLFLMATRSLHPLEEPRLR